jgi:hypothetical protein
LAIADAGAPEGARVAKPGIAARLAMKHFASPIANYYDRNEFKRLLERVGFVNVQMQSIGHFVNPHYQRYDKMRLAGVPMDKAVVQPIPQAERDAWQTRWSKFGFLTDYMIISADKPAVRH